MTHRRPSVIVCLLLAVCACLIAVDDTPKLQADTPLNSWLDRTIESSKKADLTGEKFNERTNTWNDCVNLNVETWGYPWYFTPSPILFTNEDCMTPGATGYFKADSRPRYIVPYGSERIQRIDEVVTEMWFWGGPVYHIPYTNRLIYLQNMWGGVWGTNGPHTASLNIIDDWEETFPINNQFGNAGNIQRVKVKDPDFTLSDNGEALKGVSANGINISANGEWLHVLLPNRSYVVLNLDTHEVRPYAPANTPYYSMQSDVSNDGRYVVRTTEINSLKIFDTERCQSAQGVYVSRNCESIELLEGEGSMLKNLFPGKEIGIGRMQFTGNGDALDIDLRVGNNPNYEYFTYRFKPSGVEPVKYLALGDSFSSGEGAYSYRSPTDFYVDENSYNLCHQSRNSYPYLVQQSLQFEWFNSVACSGAETKDVNSSASLLDYLRQHSQAKVSSSSSMNEQDANGYLDIFSPGYVPQQEFIAKHKPTVVTISLGGNDIGFEDILSTCIVNIGLNQSCFWDRQERELLANQIDQKISKLAGTFRSIKNSMGGTDPRLYVVGYPQIIRPEGFCGLNVPLLESERYAAVALTDYINAAIKVAADAAGARYVNLTSALVTQDGDFRLCGDKPELAVNGLVLNGQSNKKLSQWPHYSESFHPNRLGQLLMAQTVKAQTADLMFGMPEAKDSTSSLNQARINFVGDGQILYQNHRIEYQKDIAPYVIAKRGQANINSPKGDNELSPQPNTTASVILHSTPREIGQLPIDQDGKISGAVSIPDDIEIGYHKLVLRFTDVAGDTIERYGYVFIAASSDDWDGDGVLNGNDPCTVTFQSNVDKDNDGIDDACDGEYVASSAPHQASNHSTGDIAELDSVGESETFVIQPADDNFLEDNKPKLTFSQVDQKNNLLGGDDKLGLIAFTPIVGLLSIVGTGLIIRKLRSKH